MAKNSAVGKILILDTNVLLFDAQAIYKFQKSDIYIPISVLEEIDRFKRDMGENGRNARQFSRLIDVLRAEGPLSQGVELEKTGSRVFINVDLVEEDLPINGSTVDNRILATALALQKQYSDWTVELVTKDTNLRIKADVFGIRAKDYEPEAVDVDEMYSGYLEFDVDPQVIDEFYKSKVITNISDRKLLANQYVVMKDSTNPNHSAIGRFSETQGGVVPLIGSNDSAWGIYPRNVEQTFAMDCLLNDEILLVSLVGKAGTGKTLLALAAGLYKTLDEGKFQRLLVSRPIFPMGRDIGYLPGDVEQKLNPWMQPIFDNVEFLMGSESSHRKAAGRTQELINQGMLNIEPLTYIRGRSIPHQYLIVDEAQNLTPHEIKTIVTRAGVGTKIVLTGDCYQIDNPYIDSGNSGLTYAVERFKGHEIAAHITLTKGERSPLAELASNIM